MNSKKLIIAGGGTGGHIFPALAIANALKKADPGIEILFVGAVGKMEMEKVPQSGFRIIGIDIAGFNRSSLIKNISLPFKLVKSFLQVRKIVKEFQPDAVIGVGGYSSFPVLRYAQSQGLPSFIHESNSFAGKSNILLGKKATRVFVASDGMEKFFPASKIMITGNPVRATIAYSTLSKEQGAVFFGLDPAKKIVLSIGGSLGAKSINEAIDANIDLFRRNDLQLIWQTGKSFVKKATESSVEHKWIWANDFITQMEYAFAAADLVISRAGAMAIAELCIVQKPVVFVPYPFAAEDHQTANAKNLASRNAGILVRDDEAKEKLVPAVIELAKNDVQQKMLETNIGKGAIKNADEIIAREILKTING